MSKFTNIPSDIRSFFNEKRRSVVMNAFTCLLEDINLDCRSLGGMKRENCRLTNLQVFQILVLFPFFAIKGYSHYAGSALCRMFGGKKDMFYSYLSQDNINWRKVIYRITNRLVKRVVIRDDHKKSRLPKVLIADDTDLPKTGMHMESIGKIFSHVHQKCILGYKALMLCWSDGRTQFMLDSSLHGEMGKIEGKEQGLTSAQRNARYERQRDKDSHISKRKNEYFMGKGIKLLEMVKDAIQNKIPFDYLLIDSWFTCTELVDFVCRCHKKFHFLGMARMGNTMYATENRGKLSAKAILTKLKSAKEVKRSRRYRCHYAETQVVLGKRAVKLFFCKRGKKEAWKLLLTTDLSLDFMRAYEIYAMRWSIEVFFSDSKRILGLADCSSRDFSAHIAHVSLVMIRYNMLSAIKRTLDYDTIGGLFEDMYLGVHELTVVEKIWAIIIEVVAVVAELIEADSEVLIFQVINSNKRLATIRAYALTA
ncbi:MAG: transposase [Bacteroides sp.]|nr:transposase [Bacteroides sp.]